MAPFNSLLNLQPSSFAVWIKFSFCSGVNFGAGRDFFFFTSLNSQGLGLAGFLRCSWWPPGPHRSRSETVVLETSPLPIIVDRVAGGAWGRYPRASQMNLDEETRTTCCV